MSGYELIVGATISDLETQVNAAIAADKTPVGALLFINDRPAQAVQDGDTVTEYAVASGASPSELKAVVTARLADDLQPSGQLARHGNLFYAPLLANGGEITAYDIVAGSTYTQLGDAVDTSGKTLFGDVLITYGVLLQQVITGTPAGGGGGGGAELPPTLNAVGTLPFSAPSVAVGDTVDIGAPDSYTIINGTLSALNPVGLVFTYTAVPGGAVPGFDGQVSFNGGPNDPNATGFVEGIALVGVSVAYGTAPDSDSMAMQLYIGVTVTAAP